MDRRTLLKSALALGLLGPTRLLAGDAATGDAATARSVEELPALQGKLTVYLGRGEGGLYDTLVTAIRKRNPKLDLQVRRGPSASLANTLVAEHQAGVQRADLFWSIDSGSLGLVADQGMTHPLPETIRARIRDPFQYRHWAAVSGRIRSVPYNPRRVSADQLPDDIMAFADSDLKIGWAPAYGAFQSFVTAMRLLEGEQRTRQWLLGVKPHATSYAGEFGVVMAVERGEVDVGFANHYYTLRLKQGMPDASVQLAFTDDDAGCLVNASGVALLSDNPAAVGFVRYLLTREVQEYLATQAFELPMVRGVAMPAGLPPMNRIDPPEVELTRLADLRPTLALMRETGVL
jgi:iron(III) transport system substrate-binding protein